MQRLTAFCVENLRVPPDQRTKCFLRSIIFWLLIGAQLSWKKGSKGREVVWVGARLRPWTSPSQTAGVTVGITPDRMERLAELCQSLTSYGPNVPKQLVRKNCGVSSLDGYTDASNVRIHGYALGGHWHRHAPPQSRMHNCSSHVSG